MSKLEKGWSPEQIDGYTKRVGTHLVSFNAIYRGINAGRNALREVKGLPFATITVDNGNEFAGHKDIAKDLGCRVYFANPYRSCERGTNENTNGRLRRYFPKGIDMRTVTEKEIEDAVAEMNDTPRNCLGFMTPKQVFFLRVQRLVAFDLTIQGLLV